MALRSHHPLIVSVLALVCRTLVPMLDFLFRFSFSLRVKLLLYCCDFLDLGYCGGGLAVVSFSVMDFLLEFSLCRLKNHLLLGHQT